MSKMMSFRMPDDLVPVVAAIAEEEGRAVSDVIARLIRAGLGGVTAPVKVRKPATRLDVVASGSGKVSLPVSVEHPAEAVQVAKAMRPEARAANECKHGNDPKFCMHCSLEKKKYGR